MPYRKRVNKTDIDKDIDINLILIPNDDMISCILNFSTTLKLPSLSDIEIFNKDIISAAQKLVDSLKESSDNDFRSIIMDLI